MNVNDSTTDEILARLAIAEPAESRGWFRWLHNHYLGRYGFMHDDLTTDFTGNNDWQGISDKPVPLYHLAEDQGLLIEVLNRHAWRTGMIPLIESVAACWGKLDRTARGDFFAGLSEQNLSDTVATAISSHLHEMDLTPDSLCQLACNSIRYGQSGLLESLLSTNADPVSVIRRFETFGTCGSWAAEVLGQVSHRVIDMILEEAVIRNSPEAAGVALAHGADPDTPVWELERSYNQRYSALGYAVFEGHREIAELLLDNGASPAGTRFAGANHELFLAIDKGWDDLAERLISGGARLSLPVGGEKAVLARTAGSESIVISPGGHGFFGHFNEELEWARSTIGSLLPLVPVAEKQSFFQPNAQGGQSTTILNKVVCNLERLKRYEALGLDTRFSAEEFCRAVGCRSSEGLDYLLSGYGDVVRDRVFAAIRDQ